MSTLSVLKDLAIVILAAEVFGLLARYVKVPQVVGHILAGLIIGPTFLNVVRNEDFLTGAAEVGVILLMFSAGLGTSLEDLIRTGGKALAIACAGVFVPLAGGTLLYMAFYGNAPGYNFFQALFVGTIMTATSVSITVQALRELGVLQGTVGTTILSAAIIDDVIGIVVLTLVLGMAGGVQGGNTSAIAALLNTCGAGSFVSSGSTLSAAVLVILNTVVFFLLALVFGRLFYTLFKRLTTKYPHHRRLPIMGLVLCLILAYVADRYFGIADITGAYVAGIILCNTRNSDYIARKMDISSYMIFGPVFFASIAIKNPIGSFDATLLWFSLAFVVVALVTKIIGCGLCSRICRFQTNESLKIGLGMMTRGEVALAVLTKGIDAGIIGSGISTAVILLIIISSILTPIFLKILYTKYPDRQPEAHPAPQVGAV